MMYYSLLTILLAVSVPFSALADDRSTVATAPAFKPRLSGIMSVTQFLQYKVWYAGKSQNWRLADYEIKLLKNSFQDAVTFYPGLAQADMTIMDKSTAQVDAAIKAKDKSAFVRSFVELTGACNNCHRSQEYGFIVVRLPTASLHRNQIFTPE
jgi:hypothetical protein